MNDESNFPNFEIKVIVTFLSIIFVVGIISLIVSVNSNQNIGLLSKDTNYTILVNNSNPIKNEVTFLVESPCVYASQISQQVYIRNKVMQSSCYRNTFELTKGSKEISKGIELTKFCGDTYAEGFITVSLDSHKIPTKIFRKPFKIKGDIITC